MNRLGRSLAAVAAAATVMAGLAGCGGDSTAEAEQAAQTYFSAPNTGEWAAAVDASTDWAQTRALFYAYLTPITGLPSGVLFDADPTREVTADFQELTDTDGFLRAVGTMDGGPDLATVEFANTDDGIKVADYGEKGQESQANFFARGDSVDSGGGLTLRAIAGRMGRSPGNIIAAYQWVSVVQNDDSWSTSVDQIVFTPSSGGAPITWTKGQAAGNGSAIAAQEEAPGGRTASIWVRQDATGTPQGGGTLTVTLSGANTTRELSVQLPTLTPPAGWTTAP